MRTLKIAGLGAVLLSLGCGGGGGSTPAGGEEVAFGEFVGRAASTNPPVIGSSNNTVVTGVTGAFTSLRMRDQVQSLAETQIVYRSPLSNDLFIMNGDGTGVRKLTDTPAINEFDPELSPDGTRVAYNTNEGGNYEIYTIKTDGTGTTRITNDPALDQDPTWSPDSSTIVFTSNRNGNFDLLKVNVSTKVVTPLVTDGFYQAHPSYSPDGKMIAFKDAQLDGAFDLATVKADGTDKRIQQGTGTPGDPTWSPDSLTLLNGNGQLYITSLPGGLVGQTPVPGANNCTNGASFSPDGKYIVYGTSANQLRAINAQTGAQEWLLPLVHQGWGPDWGPGPKDRTLIGSSSLFGATGAGFLYTTAGANTQAVLAFGATTQSTVVMKADDGEGDNPPNIIYSLDADTITYISYALAPAYKVVKVVGAGLGVAQCDGAIVSVDSADGKIVAVLPFDGSRSAGKPKVESSGSTRVITGNLLGVYDAKGENLAPSGASKVVIDKAGNIQIG